MCNYIRTTETSSIWAGYAAAARALAEALTVAAACDNARDAGLCTYVRASVLAGWQREEIAADGAAGHLDLRLRVPSGDADPCGPSLASKGAACARAVMRMMDLRISSVPVSDAH